MASRGQRDMDDGRGPVEITDQMELDAVRAQARRVTRRALAFATVVTVLAILA